MEENSHLKHQLMQQLKNILLKTRLYSPPTVGSILRIFYETEGADLSPTLINTVSQASSNEQTGICLLEKLLQRPSQSERGKYSEQWRFVWVLKRHTLTGSTFL